VQIEDKEKKHGERFVGRTPLAKKNVGAGPRREEVQKKEL